MGSNDMLFGNPHHERDLVDHCFISQVQLTAMSKLTFTFIVISNGLFDWDIVISVYLVHNVI